MTVVPFSLKDAPSLIEKVFPVQKLSVESYKEQMSGTGKTLTSLGSYWKGRKPLILNKACILGSLLPATEELTKDLKIFEGLMGIDDASLAVRLGRITPLTIVQQVEMSNLYRYFNVVPENALPKKTPIMIEDYRLPNGKLPKIVWKEEITDSKRRSIEALALPQTSYRELIDKAKRPETRSDVHNHIWEQVNEHLGTDAHSFPELIEQLGIMRFGHRPRVADTFSGSGQIPFEAARLGCDVYASDLNPIACMLTWGSLNIVGGSPEKLLEIQTKQKVLAEKVSQEISSLGIETDNKGWKAKAYLYCVEVRCPETDWLVPLIPSRVLSAHYGVIVELLPDPLNKRYDFIIHSNVSKSELMEAKKGTVRTDGRGQDPYMVHTVNGLEYKTKISTLRGDFRKEDGTSGNRLRLWNKEDYYPQTEDIYQERLYAILWKKIKENTKKEELEFRAVTKEDIEREQIVDNYISQNFSEWQEKGYIPDMRIEEGYNTRQPIWERGWTYWHHLFNPRQLLIAGLINKYSDAPSKIGLTKVLDFNSKLSHWNKEIARSYGTTANVFYNQALNTLFNYGCRSFEGCVGFLTEKYKSYPISTSINKTVNSLPAEEINISNDIYITDPPYGDAVKYEEILDFFIGWHRKNPPKEFSWIWDSRRALAIKGEDDNFRRGMAEAYKKMAENMPNNGIQIIMFTHQSGSIWADMANIVWASGLQVSAAWYVVTETMKRIQDDGSYVKGTVLLVLRKRDGNRRITRDDLAWEIQDEVEEQVRSLTGLNQEVKHQIRDENLFEDSDIQMAGYAAALRVLTKYDVIDGKDMTGEALRPRIKGQITFVDELIDFAVDVANQSLVPEGIEQSDWDKLTAIERFYLKLIELEARGIKALDNYQNFAKAFKVKDFRTIMASQRANSSRLKSAVELSRSEMSEDSEFGRTRLRGILYSIMELSHGKDGDEVLEHLSMNVPNYYDERQLLGRMTFFLAKKLKFIRQEEATSARILRELIRNQRI